MILSNSRIYSSAKFWLSCCPFAEGFLFKRSYNQANQSRITTEGKTIFRFPATERIAPAILESSLFSMIEWFAWTWHILALSVLDVNGKGFFAFAYDVCIESKRFGTVFSTLIIHHLNVLWKPPWRKRNLWSQRLYLSSWARESLKRLSQWINISSIVPSSRWGNCPKWSTFFEVDLVICVSLITKLAW